MVSRCGEVVILFLIYTHGGSLRCEKPQRKACGSPQVGLRISLEKPLSESVLFAGTKLECPPTKAL